MDTAAYDGTRVWVATNSGASAINPDDGTIELGDDAFLSRWAVEELRRSSPTVALQAMSTLGRFSSHSWIGRVDVPTSVVVTQRDRLVPASRQLKLARSIPGAVVHVCDGDHLVCATSPGRFLSALIPACDLVASRAS